MNEAFDDLLRALKRARDALYNGFEPDNQSRAYHDAEEAIKVASAARLSYVARPVVADLNLSEAELMNLKPGPITFVPSRLPALEAQVDAARLIILRGVDIMTSEQVGKWAGVREWLERETESYISPNPQGETK